MSPLKMQGAGVPMVWCRIRNKQTVWPVSIDTDLSLPQHARRQSCHPQWMKMGNFWHTFRITLWYLHALLARSAVSSSLDWSPWSRWISSEISRTHLTWFLLVGAFEGHGVPGENTKYGTLTIKHYRSMCAHNKCIKVSSPWVTVAYAVHFFWGDAGVYIPLNILWIYREKVKILKCWNSR
jgi:hypothetical protein